jgi:hypothetical protein
VTMAKASKAASAAMTGLIAASQMLRGEQPPARGPASGPPKSRAFTMPRDEPAGAVLYEFGLDELTPPNQLVLRIDVPPLMIRMGFTLAIALSVISGARTLALKSTLSTSAD